MGVPFLTSQGSWSSRRNPLPRANWRDRQGCQTPLEGMHSALSLHGWHPGPWSHSTKHQPPCCFCFSFRMSVTELEAPHLTSFLGVTSLLTPNFCRRPLPSRAFSRRLSGTRCRGWATFCAGWAGPRFCHRETSPGTLLGITAGACISIDSGRESWL